MHRRGSMEELEALSGFDTRASTPGIAPGKRTLTANLQRRQVEVPAGVTAGTAPATAASPAADPFWFADGGSRLPHHDVIQASFGRHDVGGIQAHVGGTAADNAAGLGAAAYATGNHVAFAERPDLFTAAHEAAHVVQQRAGISLLGGIDGGDSDPLERHADEVADAVVQGRSAEGLLDRHAGNGGTTPSPLVQRRRVVVINQMGVCGIDTENLPRQTLEELVNRQSLPEETRAELRLALENEEHQGGNHAGFKAAREQLGNLREKLPARLDDENEYSWLRSITGGGANSLTGKRNPDGSIKTDMSEGEYDTTERLTTGFYDTAAELLDETPRNGGLTLYRGFCIAAIEGGDAANQVAQQIRGFSDTLPSSASWQAQPSIDMSRPGDGQSAVLVHMSIPREHPIVIMSYPDNSQRDNRPKPIDIGQAEVLVAASTYENAVVSRVQQLEEGRVRYHVSVTLVARDRQEVMNGIQLARETADAQREPKAKTKDFDTADFRGVFGEVVGAQLEQGPVPDQRYVALSGQGWIFKFGDDMFGYTFEEA